MYFSVFVVALWKEYTGALMELCQGRRGTLVDMKFVTSTRGSIVYEIPLAEVTRRRDSCSTWYSIYFLREWLLLLLLVVVVVLALLPSSMLTLGIDVVEFCMRNTVALFLGSYKYAS